jgi:GTP-binding protein HflX
LIASFKATLEEARQADLLLHVADASNPAVLDQITSVYRVLEEIGIQEKDTVLVLNKIDAIAERGDLHVLMNRYPHAVPISARRHSGLDRLAAVVSDALSRTFLDLDVETSVGNGRLFAFLASHGEVLSRHYHDDRVTVHCRLPRRYVGQIDAATADVRPRHAVEPSSEESAPLVEPMEDVA